jgi:hypothetical protein
MVKRAKNYVCALGLSVELEQLLAELEQLLAAFMQRSICTLKLLHRTYQTVKWMRWPATYNA